MSSPATRGPGDAGRRHAPLLRPAPLRPITVTVGLAPAPRPGGAIGEVRSSEWAGLRHEELGQAQAWYYPEDRLLLLWECYLLDRFREDDPRADDLFQGVWRAVEAALRERLPEARRCCTTREDTYNRPI